MNGFKSQRGFLMIAAVTIIVIFGLLGTCLSYMFRSSSDSLFRFQFTKKASSLAETGLELGKELITDPDLSSRQSCSSLSGSVVLTTGTATAYAANDSANNVNPRQIATTLSTGITTNSALSSITVASTAALAPSGAVLIGREVLKYKRIIDSTSLGGISRGQSGSIAAVHPAGTYVSQYQCMLAGSGNAPTSNPKGIRLFQQGFQESQVFTGGASGSILLFNHVTSELLWLLQLTGISSNVNGMDMINYHLGWAVADRTSSSLYTVLRYQNGTWAAATVSMANAQDLQHVSAPSENEAWAVGDQSSSGVYSLLRWAGGATNAWCRLTSNASACGGKSLDTTAFSYSGALHLLDIDTLDITGDGLADFGFAVGGITTGAAANRVRILIYDGTEWNRSAISINTVQRLLGIKIIRNGTNTPIEAWAVGESTTLGSGVILRWFNGVWSLAATTNTILRGVDMIDTNGDGLADYGIAVGNSGRGYIYSGGSWSGPNTWGLTNINAVVVLSPTEFYAVGDLGLRIQFNGLSISSLLNLISLTNFNTISAVFPQKEPFSPWYEVIN